MSLRTSRGWLLVSVSLVASGGAIGVEAGPEEEPYRARTYHLVLLAPAADASPMGEREIQRVQQAHLEYLRELHGDGRALLSGPLDAAGELHGAVVLEVESVQVANRLVERDPWVRSRALTAEVHRWWANEEVVHEPTDLTRLVPCQLALLERPVDAPDYPEADLREIEAGHLANVREMTASGELALAGPIEGSGRLRAVLVFRISDAERIRHRLAADPAVVAGRLSVRIYRWWVPRGSIPAPDSPDPR